VPFADVVAGHVLDLQRAAPLLPMPWLPQMWFIPVEVVRQGGRSNQ